MSPLSPPWPPVAAVAAHHPPEMKRILAILSVLSVLGLTQSATLASGELAKVKFGKSLANGEVTAESLKGKVVVVEQWGIH